MRKLETKNNTIPPANARRAKNLIDSVRASFKFSRAVPMMFLVIFSFSTFTALLSAPLAQATISLDNNMEACIANQGTWESDNSSAWCSKAITDWNPALRAEAWAVTNAFVWCVANGGDHLANSNFGPRISPENLESGKWFANNATWNVVDKAPHKVPASYLIDDVGERGEVLCNAVIKEAAELAGYDTNYRAFYCAAVPVRADGTSCTGNGGGDFSGRDKNSGKLSDYANEFYALIKRRAFRATEPPLGRDAIYVLNLSAFKHSQGCHASPTTTPGTNQDKIYRDIKILNSEGTGFDLKTFEGENRGDKRWLHTTATGLTAQKSFNTVEKSCQEIADAINANADAFLTWARDNPDQIKATLDQTQATQPGVATDKPTCGIDGIGWIVCPTLGFLATVTDRAFDFLASSFLAVDTKLLDTSTPTYTAWSIMRNFANVAFVIAFLVIVYSQLTSAGVSNYGIKKMLPRLIVAAVLVNASYIICQLAVDMSNILGYTLKGLFDSLGTSISVEGRMPTAQGDVIGRGNDATGNGFGVAAIITALTAGAITLAFALSFPVLLATLIALLVIILILLARKAIIILLIIVAPLAFVAYLLPNTENLFKKWQKMFTTLLLVFPVISILFGSATLAAGLIKATAPTDQLTQLIAVGVAAMPLFLVPALLKGATAAAGAIGGKLNGWGDKAQSNAFGKGRKTFDSSMIGGAIKHRENMREDRRNRIATGNYRGRGGNFNPRNLMASANKRLNDSSAFNAATGGFGAQRDLAAQSQNRKDTQEAMSMFNNDDKLMKAWAMDGGKKGSAYATSLNPTQQKQYDQMRLANHHQKATSFMAAADYMSTNGKADLPTLQAALSAAKGAGASEVEIDSAKESARAAYRKSGRGDILGQMAAHEAVNSKNILGTNVASAAAQQAEMLDAWKQVSADSVHREAIDPSNTAGIASFNAHLADDPDNTRKALAGFDKMEARAQSFAKDKIIAAAQHHEYNATGMTPTISTIQEAKAYFGVV